MKRKTNRQKAIVRRRIFIAILAVLLATIVALLSVVICAIVKNTHRDDKEAQRNRASYNALSGSGKRLEDRVPLAQVQSGRDRPAHSRPQCHEDQLQCRKEVAGTILIISMLYFSIPQYGSWRLAIPCKLIDWR